MSWRKPTSFFVACITMPKGHAGVKCPRDTNQLKPQIDPALTAPAAPPPVAPVIGI
jgi:hypothetical protein